MNNKRSYRRSSHFRGQAAVSRDGEHWEQADVANISSSGLNFRSATQYTKGELLWFDLILEGFLSKMEIKVMGEVRRKASYAENYQYGIRFKGLSPEKIVQLDANIHGDRPVFGGSYEAD